MGRIAAETEARLQKLKAGVTIKASRNVRQGYRSDESARGMYRHDVRLNVERNRLLTESYKMTDGEPYTIRRAKAMEHILLNKTVYILDNEQIVGASGSTPNELYYPMEVNWESPWRAMHEVDAQSLLSDEKDEADTKAVVEYWKGKTLSDIRKKAFKGELEKYWKYEGTFLWSQWDEGGVPNYEKLFRIGINGIKKQAEAKLEEVIGTLPDGYLDKKSFLEAVIMCLEAIVAFAHRYAEKARQLAAKEKDETRKNQLERIATTCDWVPANSPRTFQEALQSFWFIHMITKEIEFSSLVCGARLDVLFGPYYEKDLAEGRITREEATELLALLALKFEESGKWFSPLLTSIYGGVQRLEAITLGGVDVEGKDVTNEVTYMMLDVAESMQTTQPSIALRVHRDTPEKLLSGATDVIRTGVGYPSLFNDEVLIPLCLKWGAPLEDARNYSISGCVYLDIPGKNMVRRALGYFVLPKCLWWALHQGLDPKTGEQYGARTPDPSTFTCAKDVLNAYLEQVRFFFDKHVKLENKCQEIYEEYAPRPLLSAFIDGCIEQAEDLRKWSYASMLTSWPVIVGPTNVADSLAAIQKFVFDEKKITMKQLIGILDKNWEGHEDLRQEVITRAPKFGNDDDYVDLLAREVHHRTETVMEEFRDYWGNRLRGDGSGVSATYGLANETPATPDGRKGGEPFSDATLSPMIGRDTKGPTAVLASCAKIDTLQTYNHLLNQKFLPQYLEGENKDVFISYLRSWCDLRIPHIQFNIVDRATLLNAQKDPESYSNLVIRVAGYSAYFVDLSKGLQDSIISRTEQCF